MTLSAFRPDHPATLEDIRTAIAAYFPDANFALVEKAFHFADKAHSGQTRSRIVRRDPIVWLNVSEVRRS